MNLGLSVVGSLLFLAPGFACIVMSHLRGPSLVRRPLYSSGSVGVLLLAPLIAIFAHGAALIAFAANASLAPRNPFNFIGFPIDPYPTLIALLKGNDLTLAGGWEYAVGWAFLYLVLLCAIAVGAYLVGSKVYSRLWGYRTRHKRRRGESRLAYLLRLTDATDGSLIGAVRTRTPPYAGMDGWIGPLDGVRLAANDHLISIRLIGPTLFKINDDFPHEEGEPAFDEFDPPFETDVLHIEQGEVLSVEYFYLPPDDDGQETELELEGFQQSESETPSLD